MLTPEELKATSVLEGELPVSCAKQATEYPLTHLKLEEDDIIAIGGYTQVWSMFFVDKLWALENSDKLAGVFPSYILLEYDSVAPWSGYHRDEQQQEVISTIDRLLSKNFWVLPFYYMRMTRQNNTYWATNVYRYHGVKLNKYATQCTLFLRNNSMKVLDFCIFGDHWDSSRLYGHGLTVPWTASIDSLQTSRYMRTSTKQWVVAHYEACVAQLNDMLFDCQTTASENR